MVEQAHERFLHDVLGQLQMLGSKLPGERRNHPRTLAPEQIDSDFFTAIIWFSRVVRHCNPLGFVINPGERKVVGQAASFALKQLPRLDAQVGK